MGAIKWMAILITTLLGVMMCYVNDMNILQIIFTGAMFSMTGIATCNLQE